MTKLNTKKHNRGQDGISRSPLIYEIFYLGVIFSLAVWSIRPLLEEWGLFQAFNIYGIRYFAVLFDASPMRPLHILPYWLQWLVAGGMPIGVGILCGLLIVARYLVVRWAVSPIISGSQRAAFALLCATCVGWPALWTGRFSAAQISSILFFAVVGFSIRLILRPNISHMIGSASCVLLFLFVYQAPLLVTALLPFWAFFGRWEGAAPGERTHRFIRVAGPLAVGVLIYIGYCSLAYVIIGPGYEGNMAGINLSVNYIITNISRSYNSIFLTSPYTIVIFLLIIISHTKYQPIDDRVLLRYTLSLLAVLLLPLLSLIYFYPPHTNDPERMLFPAFLGFAMIILLLLKEQARWSRDFGDRAAILWAAPVIAWAAMCAIDVRSYWNLQSYVIGTTTSIATTKNINAVTIIDNTGLLGDIYTLYDSILTIALQSKGVNVAVTICTPLDVDRLHPVARRFPIPTTPRCESGVMTKPAIIADMVDGRLRMRFRE